MTRSTSSSNATELQRKMSNPIPINNVNAWQLRTNASANHPSQHIVDNETTQYDPGIYRQSNHNSLSSPRSFGSVSPSSFVSPPSHQSPFSPSLKSSSSFSKRHLSNQHHPLDSIIEQQQQHHQHQPPQESNDFTNCFLINEAASTTLTQYPSANTPSHSLADPYHPQASPYDVQSALESLFINLEPTCIDTKPTKGIMSTSTSSATTPNSNNASQSTANQCHEFSPVYSQPKYGSHSNKRPFDKGIKEEFASIDDDLQLDFEQDINEQECVDVPKVPTADDEKSKYTKLNNSNAKLSSSYGSSSHMWHQDSSNVFLNLYSPQLNTSEAAASSRDPVLTQITALNSTQPLSSSLNSFMSSAPKRQNFSNNSNNQQPHQSHDDAYLASINVSNLTTNQNTINSNSFLSSLGKNNQSTSTKSIFLNTKNSVQQQQQQQQQQQIQHQQQQQFKSGFDDYGLSMSLPNNYPGMQYVELITSNSNNFGNSDFGGENLQIMQDDIQQHDSESQPKIIFAPTANCISSNSQNNDGNQYSYLSISLPAAYSIDNYMNKKVNNQNIQFIANVQPQQQQFQFSQQQQQQQQQTYSILTPSVNNSSMQFSNNAQNSSPHLNRLLLASSTASSKLMSHFNSDSNLSCSNTTVLSSMPSLASPLSSVKDEFDDVLSGKAQQQQQQQQATTSTATLKHSSSQRTLEQDDYGNEQDQDSDEIDEDEDESINNETLLDLMNKNRDTFFWQYNIQSKGPKTKKVLTLRNKDPHLHRDFFDPVFQLQNLSARGTSLNKLRKGDGNDVTPNPEKLYQLGIQIRDFIQKSYQINNLSGASSLSSTPVAQSIGIDMLMNKEKVNLKREKNKIASRACRLKKKAQHEANKLKLNGLNEEHKQLVETINIARDLIKKRLMTPNQLPANKPVLELLDEVINQKLVHKVAGNTDNFVYGIMQNIEKDRSANLVSSSGAFGGIPIGGSSLFGNNLSLNDDDSLGSSMMLIDSKADSDL